MKLYRLPIGVIQIAVIGVVAVIAFYSAQAPSEEELLEASAIAIAPQNDNEAVYVSVAKLKPQDHFVEVRGTGSVVLRNSIDLVLQLSGRVVWVSETFRKGGSFEAGQNLLRIDPKDFELAVAQAEADLLAAESNYLLVKAESEAAIANYAILHGEKDVPPLVAKTPQVEQAKAQIAAASAREQIALLDLMRTDFSLPFDGRVVESQAEVGQFLNQGQKFGEVFDVASIEALVPISPRDLLSLKPAIGRRASLSLGDFQLQATIARVSPTLDERTRFAQIYLALDNATDVYPGSFFNVVVEGPRLENTILLPEAAEQINESVWVVSDNKLKRSQPRFINRQTSGVIVESFDSGDGVVLGRVPGAKEGMMVKAESG
ncbi:efflux RND transporter periplasmic adaptor subunit [Pseudomonadales bacterium]|nr:efflux RND transporter periplasmic adaptor subunit [Pseudomonadales bacterium]MDC0894380.1 efflux RND transporter periplasmic adaptor subunit [Pseudomonadales bacterium]